MLNENCSNDRELRLPFAIAALCSLKVVAPALYEKAKRGSLSFKEIASFLGMDKGEPQNSAEKWQYEFWRFLLDPADVAGSRDFNSILFKYHYNSKHEVIPSLAYQIDKLKA